jgi:leucyl-tRNA synthetase
MKFNTAISALMVLSKAFESEKAGAREDFAIFLQLLAPFAPHIAEELWHENNFKGSVHKAPWPTYDEAKTREASVTIVIQVNGKIRGSFFAPRGVTEADAFARAEALPEAAARLSGKQIKKRFFVKDRLVSFVTT